MTTANQTPDQIERDIERTRSEMSDTLDAIQERLVPSRLLGDALGQFGDGAGDFAANLGRAARENPLPVALVGIGLGWLILSTVRSEEDRETETVAVSAGPEPGQASRVQTVSEAEPASADREGALKGAARQAREGVVRAAEDLRAKSQTTVEGVREKVGAAREGIARVGGQVSGQARRAGHGFGRALNEHPLVMAAAGLAVGAAVGAMLPATRKEDALVGETRDRLKDKVIQQGRDRLDQAERVAKSAARAAKEEADRQGLTGQTGESEPGKPKTKAGTVAASDRKAGGEQGGQRKSGSSPTTKS